MEQQPQRRQKKNSGFSWIGLLIFLVFAIGPQLLRVARNLFAGASLTLPSNIPVGLIVFGVIVLAVVASSAIRLIRSAQRNSEMHQPTTLTPQSFNTTPMTPRQRNAPMPPFGGFGELPPVVPPTLPSEPTRANLPTNPSLPSPQRVPSAPRFEPIITGKAVAASLGITLLFGLVYLLAQALS